MPRVLALPPWPRGAGWSKLTELMPPCLRDQHLQISALCTMVADELRHHRAGTGPRSAACRPTPRGPPCEQLGVDQRPLLLNDLPISSVRPNLLAILPSLVQLDLSVEMCERLGGSYDCRVRFSPTCGVADLPVGRPDDLTALGTTLPPPWRDGRFGFMAVPATWGRRPIHARDLPCPGLCFARDRRRCGSNRCDIGRNV